MMPLKDFYWETNESNISTMYRRGGGVRRRVCAVHPAEIFTRYSRNVQSVRGFHQRCWLGPRLYGGRWRITLMVRYLDMILWLFLNIGIWFGKGRGTKLSMSGLLTFPDRSGPILLGTPVNFGLCMGPGPGPGLLKGRPALWPSCIISTGKNLFTGWYLNLLSK